MSSKKSIACPTCKKKDSWKPDNPYRPFCSERCKIIDLGDWASDKHRIAGEAVDPEDINEDESDSNKK